MIKAQPKPWIGPPLMSYVEQPSAELLRADVQWGQLERNGDWFESHAQEIYSKHRDRFICVAGAELFVAASWDEAVAAANAKHPDDHGRILRFVPATKLARI